MYGPIMRVCVLRTVGTPPGSCGGPPDGGRCVLLTYASRSDDGRRSGAVVFRVRGSSASARPAEISGRSRDDKGVQWIHADRAPNARQPHRGASAQRAAPARDRIAVRGRRFTRPDHQARPRTETRADPGGSYASLKRDVADAIVEDLRPIQRRYGELSADPAALDATLRAAGAERAAALAAATVDRAKRAIGLLPAADLYADGCVSFNTG